MITTEGANQQITVLTEFETHPCLSAGSAVLKLSSRNCGTTDLALIPIGTHQGLNIFHQIAQPDIDFSRFVTPGPLRRNGG